MVVCSSWLATRPFSENDGADMSSARTSMADVSGARREARRASGGEHGGVEGVEENGEEFGRPRGKRPRHRDARQQGQARAHSWWPRQKHVSPKGAIL
jgi:hypothetical protein